MSNIRKGNGHGFTREDNGQICMIRCFECGRENYAMAVYSGTCAWCGHDANAVGYNLSPTEKEQQPCE